jgi:hypothetical protein
VHPGLSRLPNAKNVLILGGGDGLAAREVLRYPRIESITLVDLDPAMTRLFATNELLTPHNQNALTSPRVKVENADAFIWSLDRYFKQDAPHFDAAASGITTFRREGRSMAELHAKLEKAGVVSSLRHDREGRDYLRFSPHFYNTEAELDTALALL